MPLSARTPVLKRFDYDSLDAAEAVFVQQQTNEIRSLMKRTSQGIFDIGQRLTEVKRRLGHGKFGVWLEAEFEWGVTTAWQFMKVAEAFKSSKFEDLRFGPSALYLLAAPSTPEAARQEAIARAEAGEPITYTAAKKIKQKHALSSVKSKPQSPKSYLPISEPNAPLSSSRQHPDLEIIEIQPQESQTGPRTAPVPVASTQVLPKTDSSLALQQEPQLSFSEQPGTWWQLGRHLLYCGDPNSPEFLNSNSSEASLLLAFPSTSGWQSRVKARASVTLSTQYPCQGNDVRMFEDMIELMLFLYSKVGDLVVSSFLPFPEILSVINRHERRGLFADPDKERCKGATTYWKKVGLKVKKIKPL